LALGIAAVAAAAMSLALKPGNFGRPEFFSGALTLIRPALGRFTCR
jgi:uncharacterized protein YgbK (DUF1537 family)